MSDGLPTRATPLVLYDDASARRFEPFALTRPIATLVAGSQETWKRWQTAFELRATGVIVSPHLADFDESLEPVSGVLAAGTIVANSRFAPAMRAVSVRPSGTGRDHATGSRWANPSCWRSADRVAAIQLLHDTPLDAFVDGGLALEQFVEDAHSDAEIAGQWHDHVWDYVRLLQPTLTDDITQLSARWLLDGTGAELPPLPPHVTVLGPGTHPVVLERALPGPPSLDAPVIEPHVVMDVSAGPIFLAAGSHLRAFTRLVGPCLIGRATTVVGGDITGCSIGPACKVRGEISSSVMAGYSNKGHEGFIGHSYLGRWVNLGAGTTTSNLKNTYGTVALWTPDGLRPTGMQFLGTLFGDHAKTGIGTMLTTGTVVGAGANIYGTAIPPKVVAPFAWGDGEPYGLYELGKFLESADRMMMRRQKPLTDRMRRHLATAHVVRWHTESSL